MKAFILQVAILVTACQENPTLDFNCDRHPEVASYETQSGKAVTYKFDAQHSEYLVPRLRPKLEDDDGDFVAYRVFQDEGFISIERALIIPSDIFQIEQWELQGVACERTAMMPHDHDIVVDAVCRLGEKRGQVEFSYSLKRGVTRIKETCEGCGENEDIVLKGTQGILKACP